MADSLLTELPAKPLTLLIKLLILTVFGPQLCTRMGFPGSSDGKASAYNVEDLGLIPGSERYEYILRILFQSLFPFKLLQNTQ